MSSAGLPNVVELPRDYLPLSINVEDAGPELGVIIRPTVAVAPGSDIHLRLSPFISTTPGYRAARLHRLALAYCRGARSVYVRGGHRQVREDVAMLLSTAFAPDVLVLWDDRRDQGPQLAPRFLITRPVLREET